MRNEKGQFINGDFWKGRKHSEASKQKMRSSHLGKPGPWAGKQRPKGENSCNWKGDNVGYGGIHDWVRKELGTPKICKNCGIENLSDRKYNWANISGEYKRDLKDWIRLCAKCHKNYDLNNINICL